MVQDPTIFLEGPRKLPEDPHLLMIHNISQIIIAWGPSPQHMDFWSHSMCKLYHKGNFNGSHLNFPERLFQPPIKKL